MKTTWLWKKKALSRAIFPGLLALAALLAIQCSSVPSRQRIGEKKVSLEGRTLVTVVLPHTTDAKEIASINAGILSVTKSEKMVPTLPDALKPLAEELIVDSMKSSMATKRPTALIDYAKKVTAFNTMLLVKTTNTNVTLKILGFTIHSDPGVLVESVLYDVEKNKVLAVASYPARVMEQGKLAGLNSAARNAMECLLGEK